ncbi:MAG: glycosyltransferase family 2 protein [Geobacteraceae bacterium]|nr:glycosyltransferase family 2 protein [Geobacteraceae bacterium]
MEHKILVGSVDLLVNHNSNPILSVVYLTKNGGDLFRKSLAAVLAQETDFTFEVVVVDSGSTDGTLEFLQGQPVRLHQIPPEEFNFGLTRDYAFGMAEGAFIVSVSQDAVPANSLWLRELLAPFDYSAIAVVQGIDLLPADRPVFYWEAIGMFYQTRDCRKWNERHRGIGLSFANCALRKSVWQENRLGRVYMSEDRVFQQRITAKGHQCFIQWGANCFHSHGYPTISTLAKRCMNEGVGYRNVEVLYTVRDLIFDLLRPTAWYFWLLGLLRGRIRSLPELFFPLVRPLSVFMGNRFCRGYIR